MNKIDIVVVPVGEKAKKISVENELDALQKIVGGHLEAVCCFKPPAIMICNEEGKYNGSSPNRPLYGKYGEILDIIYGDFFIVGTQGDEFCSLSEELIKKYIEMFS